LATVGRLRGGAAPNEEFKGIVAGGWEEGDVTIDETLNGAAPNRSTWTGGDVVRFDDVFVRFGIGGGGATENPKHERRMRRRNNDNINKVIVI